MRESHVPSPAERPRIDLVSRAGITGFPAGFVPRCPRCRYDLTGLRDGRCPECGARYAIASLIAEWRARQARRTTDSEFLFGALLMLPAMIPVDLRDLAALAWKAPVLACLWGTTWVWLRRRSAELHDPEEAHRLLWLWAPCVCTAIGVARTPILNEFVPAVMLLIAGLATVTAWRRAPERTSVVASIALGTPAAAIALIGLAMVLSATAGRAGGHHWSFADYPSWYWQGVPGRARGVNNQDAVGLGGVLLAGGSVLLAGIVSMWALLARRWKRKVAPRRRVAYA